MRDVFLIILLMSALTSCSGRNDYKEYIPIVSVDDNLIPIHDSLTEQHRKNIQHVFKYYNIDFKIQDGKVFYKGDIDKELMWNFTLKANDTIWLKSH